MRVEFVLLGPVDVRRDGVEVQVGSARQRQVLAALLADAGKAVSTDELIRRVWGDDASPQLRNSLYGYVHHLRRALAALEVQILRGPQGFTAAVGQDRVDLHRFRDLVDRARRTAEPATAADLLEQSLTLWQGIPVSGADTAWFNEAREMWSRERRTAELDWADHCLNLGRHAEILPRLLAGAQAQPFDERLIGQVILALYRDGRATEALERYDRLRVLLAEEFGTDPDPELQRLHRHVLGADPALSPSPAASLTPRHLPAAPQVFSGRTDDVKALCDHLIPPLDQARPWVAIHGMAGVGKSALAVHVARQVFEHYPDGQLYVDLHGATPGVRPLDPHDVLVRWLRALGTPSTEIPADLDASSALWRSATSGRRLLLVLDNASDARQVRPLLPRDDGVGVIVTSRVILSTVDVAWTAALEPLAAHDAVSLLGTMVSGGRVANDTDAAVKVSAMCAGLPLLLRIVAARLNARPNWTVGALADRLSREHRRLTEFESGDLSVRASLAVSLRDAGADGVSTLAAFALAGVAEMDLPLASALTTASEDDTEETLERMVDARLLDSPTSGRYIMHDLVRLYARERAVSDFPPTWVHAARSRAIRHFTAFGGQASVMLDPEEALAIGLRTDVPHPTRLELADRPAAWAWIDFAAPQLAAVALDLAEDQDFALDVARCAIAAYPALAIRDRWPELIRLCEVGTRAARRTPERGLEASLHNLLGLAYGQTGKLSDSAEQLTAAARLWRDLQNWNQLAKSLNNLGLVARLQGDHSGAVDHHTRSIDLFRRSHDLNGMARALSNLGLVHRHLGAHDQEVATHEEAVKVLRAGGDQYRLGLVLGNLAAALCHAGRLDDAVASYREGLEVITAVGNRLGEAEQHWGLADTLLQLGELDAAREHHRISLAILQEIGHLTGAEADRLLADPIPRSPLVFRQ